MSTQPVSPGVVPAAAEVQAQYQLLEDTVRQLRPGEDVAPMRSAYEFALEKHGAQQRKSGEPYIMHPISVAQILADLARQKGRRPTV